MAWKNLAEDLAEEFGEHVFEVGYDEEKIGHLGYLGVGPRELERRRLETLTKRSHVAKTGMCLMCNDKPCMSIPGGNRSGKSLYCSLACQVRGDSKFRTRIEDVEPTLALASDGRRGNGLGQPKSAETRARIAAGKRGKRPSTKSLEKMRAARGRRAPQLGGVGWSRRKAA